jgi:glutamine amidotransferase
MQVMASRGVEFGEHAGLGWLSGTVERLKADNLPLPHVGWNNVSCRRPSPLLEGLENGGDFYFVHSFAFHVGPPEYVIATTEYENEFCSVVQHDNLFGVQFHPEKSQRAGLRLARNFLSIS